jgi:two-component system sensor histidine kinase FlrB
MPNLLSTRQEFPETAANPGSLAKAFEAFTSTADSLQQSYGLLQSEVGRLRQELNLRNRDLARSLAENERMRARLGHILENLPCGVIVLNAGSELRYANDAARRLLASAAARDNEGPLPSPLRHVLQQVSEAAGAENVWSLGEGREAVRISVTGTDIPEIESAVHERVFIMRDITGEKQLEEEREFSHRMQALAEMTGLLAHEVRNPLGSLELFAGLVKDATRDQADVSQWMVHLQAGLRALSATVNNVLHFYSQAQVDTALLNLNELLRDTVRFLEPMALQRGMSIGLKEWDDGVSIRGDRHRLQQAFFNIVINALNAMSSGGRVAIGLSTVLTDGRPWASLDFEDEGPGIPAAILTRIFEAGFTTQRTSPGLGLAVAKRVMEQHGGILDVHSAEGRGTTFTLRFPEAHE